MSGPPPGHGLAGDRMDRPTEISSVKMFNFEKSGVFPGRLVSAKGLHDPERRGAFERPPETGAGNREVGLRSPVRKLRCGQKKTARMRIVDALERDAPAERLCL